jgi:hypothetical protein
VGEVKVSHAPPEVGVNAAEYAVPLEETVKL